MADMRSKGEKLSGNDSSPSFDNKMEEPQKAILAKNWRSFKRFFEKDPKAIMEPLDLSGNTAVHVAATRWNKPGLIRELLEILPKDSDRWQALRKGNAQKNTVLHQVIHCKNVMMVDAVLDYGKQLKVPQDKEGEDKDPPLLELMNDQGETPVYRAAKYGKLDMLKHMARLVDMRNHFYRRRRGEVAPTDRTSILHIAIMGQHLEVALWLISKVDGIDELARADDGNDLTCLQLLSGMPSVFKSYNSQMGLTEKLIYACVPVIRYDGSSNDNNYDDGTLHGQGQYKKKGKANALRLISLLGFAAFAAALFINAAFLPGFILSLLAIIAATIHVCKELVRFKKIWKRKKQNKLAEKLADFLVMRDNSWMYSKQKNSRNEIVLPLIQLSNVTVRKKGKQANEEGQSENLISPKVYTPLLLAASTGIVEIVKKIVDLHPDALSHVSHDEHNILHVTVKHRQKKIYKLLKKYGALKSLAAQMSNKGCTLLHYAAMMDHYDGGSQAGVVFQLQEELLWFERVKKITPRAFILHRNDDNLTARELFELEHSDMLNKAQAWIKGTAQSCSAVAVLVATFVFPAAYSVPGGYNDTTGIPVLHKSFVFKFFIITDAMALTSSILSVMMFLSILTSPFQMQEFLQGLPLKLSSGFIWLFISLTATMVTFVTTIFLTFGWKEMGAFSVLISSIMVFPFIFFGLTQYSIFMIVKYRTKKVWKALKKIVPKWLIKLTTKWTTKERVYSKYS